LDWALVADASWRHEAHGLQNHQYCRDGKLAATLD
jgi:hypothetical protein